MNLLSTLRERIERADALVMDLAGHNPNVLIEVGMAVALYKGESGALIILKPKDEPWPSNLQGIVYCNYDKSLPARVGRPSGISCRAPNAYSQDRDTQADAGFPVTKALTIRTIVTHPVDLKLIVVVSSRAIWSAS